jgi:hypothetical protein
LASALAVALAGLIVLVILASLLAALAALLAPLALLLTGLLTHLLLVLLTGTLLTLIVLVCHVDFLCWREPRLQNQQVECPVPASSPDLKKNVGTISSFLRVGGMRTTVRQTDPRGNQSAKLSISRPAANRSGSSWKVTSFPAAFSPAALERWGTA